MDSAPSRSTSRGIRVYPGSDDSSAASPTGNRLGLSRTGYVATPGASLTPDRDNCAGGLYESHYASPFSASLAPAASRTLHPLLPQPQAISLLPYAAPLADSTTVRAVCDAFEALCLRNTERCAGHRVPCVSAVAWYGVACPDADVKTCFHSVTLPGLSLYEMVVAMSQLATLYDTEADALIALSLMGWYCAEARVPPTLHMMHRLYAACLQVGMKAHRDTMHRNSSFARAAGVETLEMNRLEAEALRGLNWKVHVERTTIDDLVCDPSRWYASRRRSGN